jgi:hypothetical protein
MSNLTASSSGDPLTLVFGGLWDMMENSVPLNGLVAVPNRIKFLGNRQEPLKDQQTDSDRPELVVEPGTPFIEPDQLTTTELIRCRWEFTVRTNKFQLDQAGGIDTGSPQLGASLFPVMWALFQTLLGYGQAIKALQYQGNLFVYRVSPGSPWVGLNPDLSRNEGLIGWMGVWPFYTWLSFQTLITAATTVE